MGLMDLNDASMVKIMKCLDIQQDTTTLSRFRKCSYWINQIAVKNNLHKMKESSVRFTILRNEDHTAKYMSCTYQKYMRKNHSPKKNLKHKPPLQLNTQTALYETRLSSRTGQNTAMEKMLTKLKSKTDSIRIISFSNLNMDSELLEVLKRNFSLLRTTATVFLTRVVIHWTSAELLEFMKIFDNLDKFDVESNLKTPILTDEHLALVKDTLTINNSEKFLAFPDITSKIVDIWIKNDITFINLERVTTNIAANSFEKLLKHLHRKKSSDTLSGRANCVGYLAGTDDFYRRMALVQRERGIKWTNKVIRRRFCKYETISDECASTFYIFRPYEAEFFVQLHVILELLRYEFIHEETFKRKSTMTFEEISDHVEAFQSIIRMTRPTYESGEDLGRNIENRLVEVDEQLRKYEVVQRKIDRIIKWFQKKAISNKES